MRAVKVPPAIDAAPDAARFSSSIARPLAVVTFTDLPEVDAPPSPAIAPAISSATSFVDTAEPVVEDCVPSGLPVIDYGDMADEPAPGAAEVVVAAPPRREAPRPSRRRTSALIALIAIWSLIAGGVVVVVAFDSVRGDAGRARVAADGVNAVNGANADAVQQGSATPEPSTSTSASAASPSSMGLLRTSAAPAGYRIFVDGQTVGQTPAAVLVDCGARSVKVGSAGRPRTIDVPCGGEISVGR
jgi:hypothetical protein